TLGASRRYLNDRRQPRELLVSDPSAVDVIRRAREATGELEEHRALIDQRVTRRAISDVASDSIDLAVPREHWPMNAMAPEQHTDRFAFPRRRERRLKRLLRWRFLRESVIDPSRSVERKSNAKFDQHGYLTQRNGLSLGIAGDPPKLSLFPNFASQPCAPSMVW